LIAVKASGLHKPDPCLHGTQGCVPPSPEVPARTSPGIEQEDSMSEHGNHLLPPDWAFEFHGHLCPFMPLGYRMGRLAIARLGVAREQDHTLHVVCELGEGHPQTCLMDGI